MDSTKKTYHLYLMLFTIVLIAFCLFQHGTVFKWWNGFQNQTFYNLTKPNALLMMRLFLAILSAAAGYYVPSITAAKKLSKEKQKSYRILWVILLIPFVYGYFPWDYMYHYNMIVLPMLMFMVPYYGVVAWTMVGGDFNDEDPLAIVNKSGGNDSFIFPTKDKGDLWLPLPFSSLFVLGAANAGKSGSWANRIIDIAISRMWSVVVYDLKGESNPLGTIAYNSLKKYWLDKGETKYRYACINVLNLRISTRVNPISPKYINSKLKADAAATTLMLSLKKEWAEKGSDFWSDNAVAVTGATIWMTAKDDKYHHLCNIPSIVTLINGDEIALMNWLMTDDELKYMIRPIFGAYERGTGNQLSGVFSSVQLPLAKLMNPQLYWIFSPSDEEAFDLDVKMGDPAIVSVSNDKEFRASVGPAISVLLTHLKNNVNREGGNDVLFEVDEIATVYIDKWAELASEARSARVMSVALTQNYQQLVRELGKTGADSLTGALGSWAVGGGTDMDLAKLLSSHFGTKKVADPSYNTSYNEITFTERMTKVNVLEPHEITGQEMGEFTGMIMDGKPSRFRAKLEYFDPKKEYKEFVDIPERPFPMETGDPELDEKLFNEIVQHNYLDIIQTVEKFIEPFKEVENETEQF